MNEYLKQSARVVLGLFAVALALVLLGRLVDSSLLRWPSTQLVVVGWWIATVIVAWWIGGAILRGWFMIGSSRQEMRPYVFQALFAFAIGLVLLAFGKWGGFL